MYVSFDPGATTGYVKWDDNGEPTKMDQLDFDGLMDLMRQLEIEHETDPIKAVIYEHFKLFKHKAVAQTGSDMPAAQAIGIIKTMVKATGAFEVAQAPNILTIAQKWTGMQMPSNHDFSHWVSAFNHGAFFLIKKGIRKTALEMESEADNLIPEVLKTDE